MLADKAFSGTKQHGASLLVLRLRPDEAHLRALRRDDYCLGIGRVVFLLLHERPHVLRCNQPHLMTTLDPFTGSIARTTAGLHHDECRRLVRRELPELRPCQLLAEFQLPRHRGAAQLENIFCQINTDHCILQLVVLSVSCFSTPQPRDIAMPSGEGGNHPICITAVWSMLAEMSTDNDNFQGTAGRTSKGLRAA